MHNQEVSESRTRQLRAMAEHLADLAIGIATPSGSEKVDDMELALITSYYLKRVGGLKGRLVPDEERMQFAQDEASAWDEIEG